jgi:hypothetical protein
MNWKDSIEEDLSVKSILIFGMIGLIVVTTFLSLLYFSIEKTEEKGYILEITDKELQEIEFGDGRK